MPLTSFLRLNRAFRYWTTPAPSTSPSTTQHVMTPNDPAMTLLKPHLVVPLYIYPSPGAWEPLFQAARDSPSVSFIVVVNPCNGPGVEALPDSNYRNVLAQLSTFPNIQVLGYVYCSYGTRPIADVQKDISIYSGWNLQFKMNGIFFDEVPSTEGDLGLMTSLAHFSRSIWNQSTGQSGILVYNPGVAVGEGFYRGVDLVVAFEQSEHQWQSWYLHQDNPIHLRNKNVAIVHSCSGDAKVLAREMVKMRLGGLYLTEQSGGGYTHWPKSWLDVVKVLDQVSITCQEQKN